MVLLTAQFSVWSGLWGRMKDLACRGPSQLTGLKVEFPQLVRIMKKCVGMGASFLEKHEITGFKMLLPPFSKALILTFDVCRKKT